MHRGAVVSEDGTYRYELTHRWGSAENYLIFVMLNPSTADSLRDDASSRKCDGFAERNRYSGMGIVNVFAYRATKPKDLWLQWNARLDAIGPLNDDYIRSACRGRDVVLAWGAEAPIRAGERTMLVERRVRETSARVFTLGRTMNGHPRHPLYVPYSQELVPS